MAVLRDIIASVLSEVIAAQHQANLTTQRLAEEYRNDPMLRYLPVPTISVGGTEITLRFALAQADKTVDGLDVEQLKPLEVVVDTKQLAELPPESVHSITLKLSPQELAKLTSAPSSHPSSKNSP